MATPRPSTEINARQKVLLKNLQACGDEMSGQQLHRSLKPEQAMGLATVYRNLRQLQQRGLVRCRHLPNGEALYAPVERDRHHLTCVDCGKTQALDHCPIHDLEVPEDGIRDQPRSRGLGDVYKRQVVQAATCCLQALSLIHI